MNDVFMDISKGLSAMGNAAERNAAAVKVFGRAGIELVPVLVGLQENVAKAKEMGLGLDENTVKGLDEVHKLLSGIEAQWVELGRKPKIALTLELGAVMKWFQGKDHTGLTAVKEWFLGEVRDLNDSRSPYARARDAFRTKDNTVGPATPQSRRSSFKSCAEESL
jgi:hypothetical protein